MPRHLAKFISPVFLPVYFFATTITLGGVLLHLPVAQNGTPVSWLDAFFTAVSATCVTGLVVVDTGSSFSVFGQSVLAVLMQVGGLGVMTYTSLVFYMWRRRVSLVDRIAVGQSLLGDPGFHLGHFLIRLFVICGCIEIVGAVTLHVASQGQMDWFGAFFHAISAFCNAGFALYPDSFMSFAGNFSVNLILMTLIFLGGIGFYVLVELPGVLARLLRMRRQTKPLSWQSAVVLRTSLWLILVGAAILFLTERQGQPDTVRLILQSFFQSVTLRTAGFNTMNISTMTDTALFIMILFMVIGGSPGSCAGGIKTTTLRVLLSFGISQIKGRDQVVVNGSAVDNGSINKALTLTILAVVLILTAVFVLSITEGDNVSHQLTRGKFIELFFETASAFGTVGLSTGVTPFLSAPGKLVIMTLMFVGRLGPIVFLSVLQAWQTREHFRRVEKNLLIG